MLDHIIHTTKSRACERTDISPSLRSHSTYLPIDEHIVGFHNDDGNIDANGVRRRAVCIRRWRVGAADKQDRGEHFGDDNCGSGDDCNDG